MNRKINKKRVALLEKLKKKRKNFIDKTKYNNRVTLAKYNALYEECKHLKKCMITFTPFDGKMSTLLEIRREFARLIKKYSRRKIGGDSTIRYFSNIEFTKSFIPHIHIQLFFTNRTPILNTYDDMIGLSYRNNQTNSLSFARNNNLKFTYVIKNYLDSNFDLSLEKHKAHFRNVKFYTSSEKTISNAITKYLYSQIAPSKDKYPYKNILELISQGLIQIKDKKLSIKNIKKLQYQKNLKLVKIKKIQKKYVYIFIKVDQKWAYKSKRLIKGRRAKRIRYDFSNNTPNCINFKNKLSRKKIKKESFLINLISSLE